MSRLSIALLLAATALVPASRAQAQDGAAGTDPCAELVAYARDNDTRATGMTARRASRIADADDAQACTDALRVARGEISVDTGAVNYDAAAAERLERLAPQDRSEAAEQDGDPDRSLAQRSAGGTDQHGHARQPTSALTAQEPFHPDGDEATTGPEAHREEVIERARPSEESGDPDAAGKTTTREPQPFSPTYPVNGEQQAGPDGQAAGEQAQAPADDQAGGEHQAQAPVRGPDGRSQPTIAGKPPSPLDGPTSEQVAIEAILAAAVYDAQGEVIGDVDDFVALGDKPYVIVGAGGFLGLGEKDVALPLDSLVMRSADALYARGITATDVEEMEEADMSRFRPLNPHGQIELATE